MKSLLLMTAFALAGLANATDTVVLDCSVDRRPVDGALEKFVITKTNGDQYKFVLLVEGSGMGGAYKKETQVALSNCAFSKTSRGVGECNEVTPDGFRGQNRLSISRTFREGRDELRATNYVIDAEYNETVSQEISIDLSACKLGL